MVDNRWIALAGGYKNYYNGMVSVQKSNSPASFKLHELRCLDAVARFGSFQSAADALHRSHPSVFASVARLEANLGLKLLDRSGYRVELTDAGRAFHARAAVSLRDLDHLDAFGRQLASGEEAILRVVLGDLCPRPMILGALSKFFAGHPRTRLHLDYEAVTGPFERLDEGTTDLIIHRVDASRYDFEQMEICKVQLVPVVAPGFLSFAPTPETRPDALRSLTQCVIRDTARQPGTENHFLIEGAPQCSAPDMAMKKELILNRLAWGHLPDFMVEQEVRSGTLLNLQGRYLPGRRETLAVMRHRYKPHGPVAEALWRWIRDQLRSEPQRVLEDEA